MSQINVDTLVDEAGTGAPNFSLGLTGNLTGNVTGALTGNVTGALTGNVTSSSVTITGGTQSWTVIAAGTNLTFAYNGTNVMRVDSTGNITAIGNVTAYGSIV